MDYYTQGNGNELFKQYPDVVGISELREMLGIGRNLAYRIVQDGTVKAKKLGKDYIIAKQHVIEYVLSTKGGNDEGKYYS